MLEVTVICIGKLKEKYLRDASDEYIKRLSRYCKLEITELEPIRLSENPSKSEINAALEKEAVLIEKKIPKGTMLVALCIEGVQITSEQLSRTVEKAEMHSGGITFVIGSSFGLAERVKQSADICMSFSRMTFPHQLFRIMLLEQIYRAFKIEEGGAYHK